VTIHFCLHVYQQGVLEMLWDSFVLWWGYWELQIINYCLQFVNVLHCVIYITSCLTDTDCGESVGYTPQSFAQWRRWRVKLTIELTGALLFFNNQPDALIIQILFCYKTLYVSGIFSAYHQEFSIVNSALVSFMQVSDDRFQTESGWNCRSILTLLGKGHQKAAWNLPVPNVQ